jgi:hypothetical protein
MMRRYVPPIHRFLQQPHGVTSQKTAFFIATAVKTSKAALVPKVLASLRTYTAAGNVLLEEIEILKFPDNIHSRSPTTDYTQQFNILGKYAINMITKKKYRVKKYSQVFSIVGPS